MTELATTPKYEAYKDSGFDWIGDVPENWELVPIRAIFKFRNEKNDPVITENILSLSIAHGVTQYSEEGRGGNKRKDDITAYKIARPNDIVLNSMNVIVGAVGLSKYFGAISPVYYALYTENQSAYIKYYERIFQNESFQKGLLKFGKGILIKLSGTGKLNTIRMKVSTDDLKTLIFPKPPFEEQVAIANFLDKKTAQIDEAIAIKEKQIELLKERKQIIIQKAVTQGLDPDTPMKDSGVDLVGEIPEHWKIFANRVLFTERVEPGRDELPLLSVSIHSGVSSEEISEEDNVRGRVKIEDKRKYNAVEPNDIVFNMMRAWQGAIGAVEVFGMVSPAYVIAAPKKKLSGKFFEYQYRCPEFIQQMDRYSKGITDFRKRLYWDGFKQLPTIYPPYEEQLKIVEFIDELSVQTESAITLQKQQIEKLKEYKTTLINSAVTGKIKVPEVDSGC